MNEIADELLEKVRTSIPGSTVYWEKEPTGNSLDKSVLSAEFRHRKFTMQFLKGPDSAPSEDLDVNFIEQVVDDFADFFSRTIYPKEKFTRII